MNPFSISCTTCHARLKVRDAQIIGQILPCPKCGSMVMVEAPPAAAGPSQASTSVAKPVAVPPVVSDSFDNIERLLNDEPTVESGSRWKQSDSAAGPKLATGETSAADEGSPVGSPEPDPPPPMDWMATAGTAVRQYALLCGGALVGASLAVTIAGLVFFSGSPASDEDAAVPEIVKAAEASASATESPRTLPADGANEVDLPNAEDLLATDDQDIPQTVDTDAASAHDNAADIDRDVDRSDPPIVPEASPVTTSASSDLKPAADQPMESPESRSDAPLDNDGLAGFARWLQDANAVEQHPQAPPEMTVQPRAPRDRPNDVAFHPTRPVPRLIDVERRLEDTITALEFKKVSLANALRTLSDYSTIPITVDTAALGRLNISAGRHVDLLIRQPTPVKDVLDRVLAQLRLGYAVGDGHLIVTTRAESQGKPVQISHEVADLVGEDAGQADELANWIRQLVDYGSWKSQSGVGQLRVDGSALTIDHFDTTHFKVLSFCERLRIARGGSALTRIMPDRISLEPRIRSLRSSAEPITVRVWRDSNLDSIAAELESAAHIHILVNWQALHHRGWSPQDRMKFFCHREPLESALQLLLEPMGLTYRIVDPTTIQITSPEALASIPEIEFYRLPPKTTANQVKQISQRIVEQVGPAQFQPQGPGAIGYDTLSQCLIVSLPQSEHPLVLSLLPSNDESNSD